MATILLVEDDSNLREIYGARLEAEGFSIVSASDGEEALAAAVRERPDLIISDVMMPKISGFDMLDILRSTPETKDVKVIMMTALSQDEDKQRGEQLGADKYLVKSQVTLDDVVKIVYELIGSAPATATPAQDDSTASDDASQTSDDTQATPLVDDSQTTQTAPADEDINDFVANSPLMNGTAPTPSQSNTDEDQ